MTDFILPTTLEQALNAKSQSTTTEFQAGGTDVVERIKRGIAPPTQLISLKKIRSLFGVQKQADALLFGANETLSTLQHHLQIQKKHPALLDAIAHIATPQIRNQATLGGALAQRVRCPYFRQPDFFCLKKGGPICLARAGAHSQHGIFDNALCMSLQPSTLALLLAALDAKIEVSSLTNPPQWRNVATVMQTEISSPKDDNGLADHELISRIRIPLLKSWQMQHYERLSPRALADWPLVEAAVVANVTTTLTEKKIQQVQIWMGAVGRNLRRATQSEVFLKNKTLSKETLHQASRKSIIGAKPGPDNIEKQMLVVNCVESALLGAFYESKNK